MCKHHSFCSLFFFLILMDISLFAEPQEPYLSNIRQITFSEMGFEKAGEAYFSPDGSSILFQAVPKGEGSYQIYFLDLEDPRAVPKLVSTGRGACTCAYFHPYLPKIIFASSHESPLKEEVTKEKSLNYKWELTPYMNIYEANLDGSELKALTRGPAYHAECAYSPDGTQIVYASNEDGHMNLYTMNSNGEEVRQLTFTRSCYNGGPFFSPCGSKIIFRADRQKADYLQIYLMDSDGLNEKQLTDNEAVNWAPYWHPNGECFAFTTSLHGHHRYEIYLQSLKNSQLVRLTHHVGFDGLPSFSHDGTKLMWTSKRSSDGSCQVFIAEFELPENF